MSGLDELLQAARPVGLAEVLSTAALQDRVDRKYLLDTPTAVALMTDLSADHRVLVVGEERTQRYSTVYLDTADLACHRAHLQQRRLRWKARTRRYLDGDLTRLELKTKTARGRTVKTSLPLDASSHGRVDAEALAWLDVALRAAYGRGLEQDLLPALEVRYRRTTLVADTGGERVTLDTDLEVLGLDGAPVGRIRPGTVLLESKAGNRPGRADRAVRALGVHEASCSKYCVGQAMARPDLPAAPWKALLGRWFEPTGAALAA